jgi:hypothetical protein
VFDAFLGVFGCPALRKLVCGTGAQEWKSSFGIAKLEFAAQERNPNFVLFLPN